MKIQVDKISSSTKNVPLTSKVKIRRKVISENGYVIVVEILQDKKIYNQLELTSGRLSTIHKEDTIVVTLGNRRALKGYSGEVPDKLKYGDEINILNLGGIAGICTSANRKEVGFALKAKVLGSVVNKKNEPINICDYKLFSPENKIRSKIPLVMISGSCMHVGKTSVASELIKSATRKGYKVCAAKVAGIAALKDTLKMEDYGASKTVSLIDAGITSTANVHESATAITKGAIDYLSKEKPDFIVIELGDGIFGEYGVQDILSNKEIKENLTVHITCASDPPAATKMFEICQEIGIPLHLISGPVSDNSVGIDFIKEYLQKPAINGLHQGEKIFPHIKKFLFSE